MSKFHNKVKESWGIDGERLHDDSNVFKIKNVTGVKVMMPKKNIKKLFVNS